MSASSGGGVTHFQGLISIHQFIHSSSDYPILEPISAVIGRQAEYTVDSHHHSLSRSHLLAI